MNNNMLFSPKKIEYIDSEIFKMVELVEIMPNEEKSPNQSKGSLAHKSCIDLSSKVIGNSSIQKTTRDSQNSIVAIEEELNGEIIGYTKEKCKEFDKFISNIYKEPSINSIVSRKFIHDVTLKWVFETYRLKQAKNSFSSHLLEKIHGSIEEMKFYYPILNLDIEQPFCIGNVKIEFLTKDFFDNLYSNLKKRKPDLDENPYESSIEKYQGCVYATSIVKAEETKAAEIALKECMIAVDVLKICSDTVAIPQMQLSFDIDVRVKENARNEMFITQPNCEDGEMKMAIEMPHDHHTINLKDLQYMSYYRGLAVFHNFLLKVNQNPSELKQMILNSIRRFGNAISNQNLHQRIVELFTILESLLLLDSNSPIIDSVCKYGSKLAFDKAEERKCTIELFKEMYNVRSSLIHHAKEISFELEKLCKFQITIVILLTNLIGKLQLHNTKHSLLQEIDDAILKAY